MIVLRRPIAVPFGLSLVAAVLAWGLAFVAGSTSAIAAQSIIHTHMPILRLSIVLAVAGLIWTGLRFRRDGTHPTCLAAAVFFAVPLITLNQQIVTGIAVMPQNWEFNVNYICLTVGAGLMGANVLSLLGERRDWRRFLPLGLWALMAFVVGRGELRNEALYTLDNARSVVFAKVYTDAKYTLRRIDAVILPHLFDESLFATRVPGGTVVLGGYGWLIQHQPPVWRQGESFGEHAKAAADTFAIGFETLFRSGVTARQLQESLQDEVGAGNCWPSLMYFFSLNDCWPAFQNYTSPATRRLASTIPELVAMYGKFLDEAASASLANRQVLLIRAQPLEQAALPMIDSELIASAHVDVRGTPVRAYAYIQRRQRD
jgi:hypothetical protein